MEHHIENLNPLWQDLQTELAKLNRVFWFWGNSYFFLDEYDTPGINDIMI